MVPISELLSAMNARDLYMLATYNSEVARGIVHTEEWKERMAELQQIYDAEEAARIGLVRPFKSYTAQT